MKTLLLASLAIAAVSVCAQAQTDIIDATLLNGSFETVLAPGGKSNKGFDTAGADVTNWTNTNTDINGVAAPYTDTGSQNGGGAEDGAQFVFFHGGDGGAFNLTSTVIHTGDAFSLTFYGNNASGLTYRLFSSTDGTYATAATLTGNNITTAAGAYQQYFINYTALPTDNGKTIGVSLFGTGGYANVDNLVLSVTPAPAPEPSTYALMFAGLGALFFMFRVRRSAV